MWRSRGKKRSCVFCDPSPNKGHKEAPLRFVLTLQTPAPKSSFTGTRNKSWDRLQESEKRTVATIMESVWEVRFYEVRNLRKVSAKNKITSLSNKQVYLLKIINFVEQKRGVLWITYKLKGNLVNH